MQTHPNDGSNDNPDEFSEFRESDNTTANTTAGKQVDTTLKPGAAENLEYGAATADRAPHEAGSATQPAAQPQEGSPHYGNFGTKQVPTNETRQAAGTNPGGTAAPSTTDPLQRGGVAQNLDTPAIIATQHAPDDERRAAYKDDDPRYGGGTSNWPTNEPANRTTEGPDPNEGNI